MLIVLQYLALAAAFFLPWTIGGIVKFQKDGNTRSRNMCVIALIGCAAVAVLTLTLAFVMTPV